MVQEPLTREVVVAALAPASALLDHGGRPIPNGGQIQPGVVDSIAMAEGVAPEPGRTDGCYVSGASVHDLCWTQAAVGCEVSVQGGSTWGAPFAQDIDAALVRVDGACETWKNELLQANAAYVKVSGGRWPVAQPIMRGPLDMASSVLGESRFCLAVHDSRRELRELLKICAEVFVDMAVARVSETPAFEGGYLPYAKWGLLAPGTCVRMQNDAATLISPDSYRDLALDLDEFMAGQFDYSIMHTHSSGAHALPVIAKNPRLTVVQVQVDPPPSGVPVERLISALQGVQAAGKGLLISGDLLAKDVRLLADELKPSGLAIQIERQGRRLDS